MKNLIYISLSCLIIFSLTSCKKEITKSEIASVSQGNTKSTPLKLYENNGYTYEVVNSNINNPWGFDWLPDGSMLITEKKGILYHLKSGVLSEIKTDLQIYNRGQGGLLDIKVDPKYKDNGYIFLTYASTEGDGNGGNTALIRAELKNNTLTNIVHLYKATPNTRRGQHFGSRIVIDNNGYVFFTIGERGERDKNPQSIYRDGGKVYRLTRDGSIPNDNPFVNETGAKTAIWSYGHRNPQGLDIHPETKTIWLHEHGPKGGDEINTIEKGKNYGWPLITYGVNYSGTSITKERSRPGLEQPIYYWTPSIAPCGMAFVTSERYPELQGNLLVGSLKFQYLEHDILKTTTIVKRERLLKDVGRVRHVKQGPDNYIYIGVEGKGILKLIAK